MNFKAKPMSASSDTVRQGGAWSAWRLSWWMLLTALVAGLTSQAAQAGRFDQPVPMRDKGAATYYVQGHIDGYGAVEMMVDTGASYTTISETTLAALEGGEQDQADYVKDLEGIMADGSRKIVPIYRLSGLKLGENCVLSDVEAAVFPGSTRPILGLSALKKAGPFVFSFEPPELLLSNCQSISE